MKLLKCKISGTYLNSKKERMDYESIEGIIPFVDEGLAHQALKNRYASLWLEKKLGSRPVKVREVYLDYCKEVEGEKLSFIGKNIKDMDYKELQDLAVYCGLKTPLYKQESLRNSRVKAIKEYMMVVTGIPKEKALKVIDLPYDNLPNMIVKEKKEVEVEVKTETQSLNEELAEYGVEIVEEDERQEYTMETLKDLAKAKGVKHNPNIGYDKLYKRVFEG